MTIRLAERELKTKFGPFNEILFYDGQSESIALVMGDGTVRRMFYAASIRRVSAGTFLTASNANVPQKWRRLRR